MIRIITTIVFMFHALLLQSMEIKTTPNWDSSSWDLEIQTALNSELFEGIETGNIDRVQSIINDGAKITSTNNYMQTPLHLAVLKDKYSIAELLIVSGANINAQDKDGKTPLHFAVEIRNIELLELFIKHGAYTKIKNYNNQTPLDLIDSNDDDWNEIKKLFIRATKQHQKSCSCIIC